MSDEEAKKLEINEQEKEKLQTERYILKLEDHVKSTKEAVQYSLERFDILIISLSTSALILSVGFVKDVIKNFDKIDLSHLKFSWFLFTLALVSNLLSQVTGYYANLMEIDVSNNKIRVKRGKPPKEKIKGKETWSNVLSKTTTILNGVSLILLITGIITVTNFLYNNI